jgi:hypothetical protein
MTECTINVISNIILPNIDPYQRSLQDISNDKISINVIFNHIQTKLFIDITTKSDDAIKD